MSFATIFLAAGKGTRMKSDLPKVLHQIAGAPMLVHAMTAAQTAGSDRIVVVVGTGADKVQAAVEAHGFEAEFAVQEQQLGTANAAGTAAPALSGFEGDVFVMFGDTPFVSPDTLSRMAAARKAGNAVVVLGFDAETPGGYGRLITDDTGALDAIVEAKDATPGQLTVTLCNSGVMCGAAEQMFALIDRVGCDNAAQEYYLTDIIALARADGLTCGVVTCDEAETLGINSRVQLAEAEALFQTRARRDAMENGASLAAPDTVYFSFDTVIGRDVQIAPNVVFGPGVTVENEARINAFCHLEGCHISKGAVVGPFARLRPGAEIGNDARVGNFVEIKNAVIDEGAKVNHLSYVGDAHVGQKANIGAGTITCNYDGVFKHRTEIGAEAFVGSNSSLVAPVRIGDGALVASGSVITRDVADGALAITRAEEKSKPGFATRFFAALRAKKAKKAG